MRKCVLCANLLLSKNIQEHDGRATTWQCNAKRTLSSHFTLHPSRPALHASHLHFTFHTLSHLKKSDFFSPHVTSSHLIPALLACHLANSSSHRHYFPVLQSFHKRLPSTTLYCKACTRYFPVRLCTAKLAQSTSQYSSVLLCTTKLAHKTSQYYFVLQSLHKVRPSSTLYYQACTKHVPVQVQSSTTLYYRACTKYFPDYFVLQSLHKVLPSTTRITKLAESTSQYYFVLQSLHEVRPSTTLYCKACTKYFPVLLCTARSRDSKQP